jgi:hypothetical protein
VPCIGAVLHPLNIRRPVDQLAYILCHAEDHVVFVDPTLLPFIEKMAPLLDCAKVFIVMGDCVLPDTKLSPVYAYEELLRDASSDFPFDRNARLGMTETSPLGTVSRLRSWHEALPEDDRLRSGRSRAPQCQQWRSRAVDEQGRETPWDSKAYGGTASARPMGHPRILQRLAFGRFVRGWLVSHG